MDQEDHASNRQPTPYQHHYDLQIKCILGIPVDRLIELFCAFIITVFTGLLWWTSSDQLQSMLESNKINRDALVSVQRAFVLPKMATTAGVLDSTRKKLAAIEFTIPWENSGSTPTKGAFNHVSAFLFMGRMPNDFNFPDLGDPEQIPFFIGPKAEVTSSRMTIPISEIAAVQEGRMRLYLWGWVTYYDIFKGTARHITKFCHEVTGIHVDITKLDGKGRILYSHCPQHNCTDDECSK